jgi:asparagine synthase (glutamine-hydrolysing)
MCGICGSTRDPDGRAVGVMNRSMVHRGPDDDGVYVDRSAGVALGARRLSIVDVAGGHQPVGNEDQRVWAVLNGEIYNHPALRERLLEEGHAFSSRTDTEVLVHLYEELGEGLVHALEGMYAFAIWDEERRRLILGRDRYGEKPLFLAAQNGELAFASELTALARAMPGLDELDEAGLDAYLTYGYVPGPGTMIRGISQLEPGSVLVWEPEAGSTRRRYWSPAPAVASSDEPWSAVVAEAEVLLDRSMRGRLLADVPLGAFLSGGVDSALVAATAARHVSGRLPTFSVGYDRGEVDETAAARTVARQLGSDHHELILTDRDAVAHASTVAKRLDQPLGDPALVAMYALAELARRTVTVVVGGEGADELFAGYPRYRWIARAEKLDERLPGGSRERAATAVEAVARGTRGNRLGLVIRPGSATSRHLAWVSGGRQSLRFQLYGRRLSTYVEADHAAKLDRRLAAVAQADPVARAMWLDQTMWLPDDVLVKSDRAGMLASLEVRTPYLSRELAELSSSIPPARQGLRGKRLVRDLLRRQLPARASWRPKRPFAVPVSEWLRGALGDELADCARAGLIVSEGWVDGAAIAAALEHHRAGRADHAAVLWPLFVLEKWLQALRSTPAP